MFLNFLNQRKRKNDLNIEGDPNRSLFVDFQLIIYHALD